jgi:hypothetical protein
MLRQLSPAADMSWQTPWTAMGHEPPSQPLSEAH